MDTTIKNSRFKFERMAPFYLLMVAVFIYVLIVLVSNRTEFFTFENVISILSRSIALGITAIGQTFAILVASIDLSVASVISACTVFASVIMNGQTGMIVPAVVIVLIFGVTVGMVNGLMITRLRINPLIATLGMSLIIQGGLSAFVSNFAGAVPPAFEIFAYGSFAGIPFALVFFILLAVIAWVVLNMTTLGSNIYSVGGNPDAARYSGINTTKVIITAHVICSVCAAIAGLYLASRLRSGAPWIGADGVYDLESIAVVVIGGTVLSGGRGGIVGTMAGVMIFSLIDSIFNIAGVDAFAKQILRGGIIVAAVAFYAFRSKRIAA